MNIISTIRQPRDPGLATQRSWRGPLLAVGILLLLGGAGTLATGAEATALATDGVATDGVATLGAVSDAAAHPFFDLDAYLDQGNQYTYSEDVWHWQCLPGTVIYRSYLAGVKEPRLATRIVKMDGGSWLWENNLGGRVALIRYGDQDRVFPQGFELDVEGAAQVRLDMTQDVDVQAVDFRGGLPLTYGWGQQQAKFAYYHMSSHLGDEFLLKNRGFDRLNWSRDALVLGYSFYLNESLRLYAEAGWAFYSEINEPWEFQFGVDWAPIEPTGFHGAPFFAINGHVRQELNFGGDLTVQAGWAWVSPHDRRLLRIGLHYYNGKSMQYSFYDDFESVLGLGAWYDF